MNPFGNKIKVLREKQNLTQSSLAELAGVSSQFISQIERGERGVSDTNVRSLAKVLKVDENELLCLRSEDISYSTKKIENAPLPQHIQQLVDVLTMIDEEPCKKIVEDFINQTNKRLLNLLKSYDFREIKQQVLDILASWKRFDFTSIGKEAELKRINGCIQFEQPLYFAMDHSHQYLNLTLLAKDFSHSSMFNEWIGLADVSYVSEETIPHLAEKQKVIHYIWFSPIMSSFDMLQLLIKEEVNMSILECNNGKLDWVIQSYLQSTNMNQQGLSS